jgi:hypothetical protein
VDLAFVEACTQPLIQLGYEDTIARKEEIARFMGKG